MLAQRLKEGDTIGANVKKSKDGIVLGDYLK